MRPDVVIVDITLDDVLTLIQTLRVECACRRILAFAVGDEIDMLIIDYAKAGADGFFNANGSLGELVETIERIAAGELLCSPKMAAALLRQAARASPLNASRGADQALTRREEHRGPWPFWGKDALHVDAQTHRSRRQRQGRRSSVMSEPVRFV